MLDQYGYVGILLIVAIGFTIIIPLLPMLLKAIGPHSGKKNPTKVESIRMRYADA